jgi:hypothetical protein
MYMASVADKVVSVCILRLVSRSIACTSELLHYSLLARVVLLARGDCILSRSFVALICTILLIYSWCDLNVEMYLVCGRPLSSSGIDSHL